MPKSGPGKLDGLSVGIKAALRAPKTNHLVNEQIRGLPGAIGSPVAHHACQGGGTTHMNGTVNNGSNSKNGVVLGSSGRQAVSLAGRFDATALHIQHGLNATKLQSNYRPPVEHAKIEEFLVS